MRPVTPLHPETSLSIAINTPTLQVNRIKLAMSFEPLQLTWLTSRELLSRHFGQLVHRQITSIEITERLLNCGSYVAAMRAAYEYCKDHPTHTYFGVFPLDCLTVSDELTFSARAHTFTQGNSTYKVEIELSTDGAKYFASKDFVQFVTVRFHEENVILRDRLSRREKDVFELLSEGLTVKQVSKKLFLSAHTIESHKQNIYSKLGIKNMVQLGKMAERLGIG